MKLDSFEHINAGQFKLGCEVECCVRRPDNTQFEKEIKALDKRICFQYDGSIRPIGWKKPALGQGYEDYHHRHNIKTTADQAHELTTPVLTAKEGIQLVDEIFKLVKKHGYTNSSCGFHANFSPADKKNHEKINPFFLAEQPIWKRIRSDFGRDGSKYCQDVVLRKDISKNPERVLQEKRKQENGIFWDEHRGEEVNVVYTHQNPISLWRYMVQMQDGKMFGKKKLVRCHWHYAGINFENYRPLYTPDSRIEVRGFGNENYHLRLEQIAAYTDEIMFLFQESMKHPVKI